MLMICKREKMYGKHCRRQCMMCNNAEITHVKNVICKAACEKMIAVPAEDETKFEHMSYSTKDLRWFNGNRSVCYNTKC